MAHLLRQEKNKKRFCAFKYAAYTQFCNCNLFSTCFTSAFLTLFFLECFVSLRSCDSVLKNYAVADLKNYVSENLR